MDGVSWVEYFKHEYSQNYGKRPAEGPSGFGGMYVPGNPKKCEKVRDALNEVFDPPAWACTPVCLNKFNRRSKCDGKSRKDRRIRRGNGNTAKNRYTLNYDHNIYNWDYERNSDSIVGSTSVKSNTLLVGLDFTHCECQTEGDSHLTYGKIPGENGEPVLSAAVNDGNAPPTSIQSVPVGAAGSTFGQTEVSLDDITLEGKYTFSCGPITDNIATHNNNNGQSCMDVCHKTVKTLRSLPGIMELEEKQTFTPFYVAVGLLTPMFFLCCCSQLSSKYEGEDAPASKSFWPAVILTCKFYDWTTDWAFYAIPLHSARFTETSAMGQYQADTFRHVQRASLAFCLIGTLFVAAEGYVIGYFGDNEHFEGVNKHTLRSYLGIIVIIIEDIPQLTLCGVYLDSIYSGDVDFKVSEDPLTFISILFSSCSFLFNLLTAVQEYRKGKAKDASVSSNAAAVRSRPPPVNTGPGKRTLPHPSVSGHSGHSAMAGRKSLVLSNASAMTGASLTDAAVVNRMVRGGGANSTAAAVTSADVRDGNAFDDVAVASYQLATASRKRQRPPTYKGPPSFDHDTSVQTAKPRHLPKLDLNQKSTIIMNPALSAKTPSSAFGIEGHALGTPKQIAGKQTANYFFASPSGPPRQKSDI